MNSRMLVADPPHSGWRCNVCNGQPKATKQKSRHVSMLNKCEEHSGKKKPIREDVNKAAARSVKRAKRTIARSDR